MRNSGKARPSFDSIDFVAATVGSAGIRHWGLDHSSGINGDTMCIYGYRGMAERAFCSSHLDSCCNAFAGCVGLRTVMHCFESIALVVCDAALCHSVIRNDDAYRHFSERMIR